MSHDQNMGAVTRAANAEMERPDRIADMLDAVDNEQEAAATTSVDELLGIIAELSERVLRLERAMVMLLAAENRADPSEDLEESVESVEVVELVEFVEPPPPAPAEKYIAREVAPPRPTPPRPAPSNAAARPVAPMLTDTMSATHVDFDLPSHQWGGEGLTEKSRTSVGPLTPIQHSDYPEIRVPEEDKAAPKRTGPPERVIVRAALEGYPHIIESVCLVWGSREADSFLSKLVIDTRGGRKGFPKEVMDDLLVLAEVCTIKSGLKPDFTPFDRDRAREREN